MRPIASGWSRCNGYAVILSGSRFSRRSDPILGSHALPSSTSQHLTDNDTTPCSCAPATAVRHNSIIDSPASSGLWTCQESWATSCQQKASRLCLATASDRSLCNSSLALYYYTAHVPRAHRVLISLMPRFKPCSANRAALPDYLTGIATVVMCACRQRRFPG